jgi:hypothetical protein
MLMVPFQPEILGRPVVVRGDQVQADAPAR